jgi:flagellar biosynthesis GTPase FlhF
MPIFYTLESRCHITRLYISITTKRKVLIDACHDMKNANSEEALLNKNDLNESRSHGCLLRLAWEANESINCCEASPSVPEIVESSQMIHISIGRPSEYAEMDALCRT